jgi:hypothetical protein
MRRSDTKGVLRRVPATRSFDHLVGSHEQAGRYRQTERLGRLEVDGRFVTSVTSASITVKDAAVQAQNFRTPTYSETDVNGGGFPPIAG